MAEAVSVTTPAGLTLSGTLTLPTGEPGPFPAAVTVTGSGRQDRNGYMPHVGEYRPFLQIADTLGRRGIAVLRLDDRGINQSDPGPPGATSSDFADDMRGAVRYLRTRPDIDPGRIAIIGHSEGGVIAPMVAATDSAIAAVVLLAAPAFTLERVGQLGVEAVIARTPSFSEGEADELRRRAQRASEQRLREGDAWYRAAMGYDPLPTIREVRAPVLLLHGQEDTQITPEQSDTLARALVEAGNENVRVVHFPATNHLLLADPDGRVFRYPRLPSHEVRSEVLGTLADWLADHLHRGG